MKIWCSEFLTLTSKKHNELTPHDFAQVETYDLRNKAAFFIATGVLDQVDYLDAGFEFFKNAPDAHLIIFNASRELYKLDVSRKVLNVISKRLMPMPKMPYEDSLEFLFQIIRRGDPDGLTVVMNCIRSDLFLASTDDERCLILTKFLLSPEPWNKDFAATIIQNKKFPHKIVDKNQNTLLHQMVLMYDEQEHCGCFDERFAFALEHFDIDPRMQNSRSSTVIDLLAERKLKKSTESAKQALDKIQ